MSHPDATVFNMNARHQAVTQVVPAWAGELLLSASSKRATTVHPQVVGAPRGHSTANVRDEQRSELVSRILFALKHLDPHDWESHTSNRNASASTSHRGTSQGHPPICFGISLSSVTPVSRLRKPCGGRHAHSKDSRSGDSKGSTPGRRTTAPQPRVARAKFSRGDLGHRAGPRLWRRCRDNHPGSRLHGHDRLRRPDGGALSKRYVLLGDGL